MFDHLVNLTEPICQKLDSPLASITLFNTSGIEAWVTENNPKYVNHIIKQLKAFKKYHNLDVSYASYKAAYGSMPTHAASNQAIQQMYISVVPINSASLRMVLASSVTLLFITKSFLVSIRIANLFRNYLLYKCVTHDRRSYQHSLIVHNYSFL